MVGRVPFIMRWPNGEISMGETIHEIIEAVDVVPTLLECAGIQIAPHLQGESLYNLLRDPATASDGMALMEATGWKHLRTTRYRYVMHDDGRECLWDLDRDPLEYHDVAGDEAFAGILAEHRHLLLQRLLRAERPQARIWPY
jgi:arylsulfatase A-like enzyme